MPPPIQFAPSERVGRWTVLSRYGRKGNSRQVYWNCKCDCGTERPVWGVSLRNGGSLSCGCHVNVTHGEGGPGRKTRRYHIYLNMIYRCHTPTAPNYHRYGGRGISVCDRWRYGENGLSGFECFARDMGHPPDDTSLDRINNDGPYSPDNCRWAVRKTQSRNRGDNHILTAWGEEMTLVDALERAGISVQSFYLRLKRGMSETEAIETKITRPAAKVAHRKKKRLPDVSAI